MLPKDARILIVDDSVAIQAILKRHLEDLGYHEIRVSSSVKSGLEIFKELEPDVVFLDLVLPDETGVDFAVEALEAQPDTKVVITTALPVQSETVTEAISQGASEYLPKPIRRENVEFVLERLGREKNARSDFTYA